MTHTTICRSKGSNQFEEYKQKSLDRIESILDKLDIEYKTFNSRLINLKCPVHNSHKISNSYVYLNTGIWACKSDMCNKVWGKHLLNLIRAALSIDQDEAVPWQEVFDFIDDEHTICPRRVVREPPKLKVLKKSIHPKTSPPSDYYLNRGFSSKVLKEFGVGDCNSGPYCFRAVIPIYHLGGEYIGHTSRATFPECKKCKYHHLPYQICVSPNDDFAYMKGRWIHKGGSSLSLTLYGINKYNREDKVVLVEGPSCVWKLWEHGIFAVSCLSAEFNEFKLNLLKDIGINKVLLAFDNDTRGNQFKQEFKEEYASYFDICHPLTLPTKDVSDMTDEQIRSIIVPKWGKI